MLNIEVYYRMAPDKKVRLKARCHPDHTFQSLIKNCCDKLCTSVPGEYDAAAMCLIVGDVIIPGTSDATFKSKGVKQLSSEDAANPLEMQLMQMPSRPAPRPRVVEVGVCTPSHVLAAAEVQTRPKELATDGPCSRLEARYRELSMELVMLQQKVNEARRQQRALVEQRSRLNDTAKDLGERNEVLRHRIKTTSTQRSELEAALQPLLHIEVDFLHVSQEMEAMSELLRQTNQRVRELRAL